MAFWDALIGAAGSIGGALLGSNANRDAADRVAQANREAAQINADAQREAAQRYGEYLDRAVAEAAAANQRAQGTLRGMASQSAPAVEYLRGVAFSNPYELTPQQQTAHADTLRQANANLARSGLRGAGRAGVATLNKADLDFRNSAYASNRSRADSANSQLFQDNRRAMYGDVDVERDTGRTRADALGAQGRAQQNALQNIGTTTAGLTRDSGQTDASAGLANANLWGSAIGAIGSILADETKQRLGGYTNYKPQAV